MDAATEASGHLKERNKLMKAMVGNLRLAAGVFALVSMWGLGYGAARTRGSAGPGQADHKQIAAITAERDHARAELADAQMRLRITRRVIQRYADELAHVDSVNEALRRELESRPAAGRGGWSTAGLWQ